MENERNGKPKYRTRFVNEQGESFNSVQELDEYELSKNIHKNLHTYIIEHLRIKYTKEVFEFMVNHKNDLVTLLTTGNLETKHQGKQLK